MTLEQLINKYKEIGDKQFRKFIIKKPYAVLGEGPSADSFTKYEKYGLDKVEAEQYVKKLLANEEIIENEDYLMIVNYGSAFVNASYEDEDKPTKAEDLVINPLEGIIDWHLIKDFKVIPEKDTDTDEIKMNNMDDMASIIGEIAGLAKPENREELVSDMVSIFYQDKILDKKPIKVWYDNQGIKNEMPLNCYASLGDVAHDIYQTKFTEKGCKKQKSAQELERE